MKTMYFKQTNNVTLLFLSFSLGCRDDFVDPESLEV